MLDTVIKFGTEARWIENIFITDGSSDLDINEKLKNKKHCMTVLLQKYFSNQTIPESFDHNANRYLLKKDVFDKFKLLFDQRAADPELFQIMSQICSVFDRILIGNSMTFLQAIITKKNEITVDFDCSENDFKSIDTQDSYNRLLAKVRGCSDLCPCCRRPCDVDHTQVPTAPGSEYNEHRCSTGHSLRAMNGYKFEVTEEASLLMCEHLKDNEEIMIDRIRYKWSQFKRQHPNWSFESTLTDAELNNLHGKFLIVWERIGRKLCEK